MESAYSIWYCSVSSSLTTCLWCSLSIIFAWEFPFLACELIYVSKTLCHTLYPTILHDLSGRFQYLLPLIISIVCFSFLPHLSRSGNFLRCVLEDFNYQWSNHYCKLHYFISVCCQIWLLMLGVTGFLEWFTRWLSHVTFTCSLKKHSTGECIPTRKF